MPNPIIKSITPKSAQILRLNKIYNDFESLFEAYSEQLLWWNKKVNLIGPSVSRETLRLHFVHCLIPSALGLLENAEYIVDAGTGGGLPGIPLAIAGEYKSVELVDTVQKKIFAIRQMIRNLKLISCSAHQMSIGKFSPAKKSVLVTKHAFEIADLFKMTETKDYIKYVFYKGYEEGLKELKGVDIEKVNIYELDSFLDEEFFRGKAIFEIYKS